MDVRVPCSFCCCCSCCATTRFLLNCIQYLLMSTFPFKCAHSEDNLVNIVWILLFAEAPFSGSSESTYLIPSGHAVSLPGKFVCMFAQLPLASISLVYRVLSESSLRLLIFPCNHLSLNDIYFVITRTSLNTQTSRCQDPSYGSHSSLVTVHTWGSLLRSLPCFVLIGDLPPLASSPSPSPPSQGHRQPLEPVTEKRLWTLCSGSQKAFRRYKTLYAGRIQNLSYAGRYRQAA